MFLIVGWHLGRWSRLRVFTTFWLGRLCQVRISLFQWTETVRWKTCLQKTLAFNDVAQHDVVRGMSNIEDGENAELPGVQTLLILGLGELRRITKAKTYEERYKFLGQCDKTLRSAPSMADVLRNSYIRYPQCPADGGYPLPMVSELDTGPRMIWSWAHWDEEMPTWTCQPERDNLRRWGYVFWNKARLETVVNFRDLWRGYR